MGFKPMNVVNAAFLTELETARRRIVSFSDNIEG